MSKRFPCICMLMATVIGTCTLSVASLTNHADAAEVTITTDLTGFIR